MSKGRDILATSGILIGMGTLVADGYSAEVSPPPKPLYRCDRLGWTALGSLQQPENTFGFQVGTTQANNAQLHAYKFNYGDGTIEVVRPDEENDANKPESSFLTEHTFPQKAGRYTVNVTVEFTVQPDSKLVGTTNPDCTAIIATK